MHIRQKIKPNNGPKLNTHTIQKHKRFKKTRLTLKCYVICFKQRLGQIIGPLLLHHNKMDFISNYMNDVKARRFKISLVKASSIFIWSVMVIKI